MNILLIGGTVFLGRALTTAALRRGHTVTHFNRGQSAATPEGVTQLVGDRTADLSALSTGKWDAVIDTCGYLPKVVRRSVAALQDRVARYAFISSISVYADFSRPRLNESAPAGVAEDIEADSYTGATYGPLKAACEQEVLRIFGERSLIVRPGLIAGPWDKSDRFTYWPFRIARGGEVAVAGAPGRRVRVVDVRDLAEWTLHALEQNLSGTYNVTNLPGMATMQSFVEACRKVSGSDARFVWLDDAFLAEHGVGEWVEMPMWIADRDGNMGGFMEVDDGKAVAAGLVFRPIEETIRDTLAWSRTRPADYAWRAGLAAQREAALLSAWKAK